MATRIIGRSQLRQRALIGLAGAVMSGVGDVLILGRFCSGTDFDRATGLIPAHVDADKRWRSLWNGAAFEPGRVHGGTVVGLVGIGCLQWIGMRGIAQALPSGVARRATALAAAAFAVSGALTHLCCGRVILAYRRASTTPVEPRLARQPSPPSMTTLLTVSAAGALGSLAVFSSCLSAAALRRRGVAPRWWAVVTPFTCVMSTLLTSGRLPSPVGGYARPASMSFGLSVFSPSPPPRLRVSLRQAPDPSPDDNVVIHNSPLMGELTRAQTAAVQRRRFGGRRPAAGSELRTAKTRRRRDRASWPQAASSSRSSNCGL